MTSPKSLDRKLHRARRFRPTVEGLEERWVPAVTFEIGEFDNDALVNPLANDLRIRGGKESTSVFIIEDPGFLDTILFIDNESDGFFDTAISLTGAGFSYAQGHIDIDLGEGDDFVFYGITEEDFFGAHRYLTVDLGAGDDFFVFDADGDPFLVEDPNDILGGGSSTLGASISLEILAGSGADFVDLTFENIEGYLSVTTDLGGGSDTYNFLCVDTGNGGSTNLTVDTGEGNNDVNFAFEDIGSDDLRSTFNIDVTGGDNSKKRDRVTVAVNGSVEFNSILDVTANLGGGKDVFRAEIDLSAFAVLNFQDDGPPQILGNSIARFNIHGGKGSDDLRILESADSTALIDGVFSINIYGGRGSDTIFVDFEGTGDFSISETGLYYMRIEAGDGDDRVFVVSSNLPGDVGAYDIIIKLGQGQDLMDFQLIISGAGVTFGPINRILIDGGTGSKDRFVQQGLFFFVDDAFFERAGVA